MKIQTNKLSNEQIILHEWGTPLNNIILQQYDPKVYENIENTMIKESKLNHHIFAPSLLSFTKNYNYKIIQKNSIFNDFKDGMDYLYKVRYSIIEYIIDGNNLKNAGEGPTYVFKNRRDYDIGLRYVSKH